jgi:hypothetical protein
MTIIIIITVTVTAIVVVVAAATTIIEKIKTMNLIWKIELKTIKFLLKEPRRTIRNQKKKGLNWNYYYHWKNKNHKLDLNDKIESHKNFDKKTNEKD